MEIPSVCDITGNKVVKTVIKRIRFVDKLKVIEQLGKHIDIQAFSEKKDVSIKGQITIQHLHESLGDVDLHLGTDHEEPVRPSFSQRYNNDLETETPEIF